MRNYLFIGGPKDGETRVVPDDKARVEVPVSLHIQVDPLPIEMIPKFEDAKFDVKTCRYTKRHWSCEGSPITLFVLDSLGDREAFLKILRCYDPTQDRVVELLKGVTDETSSH